MKKRRSIAAGLFTLFCLLSFFSGNTQNPPDSILPKPALLTDSVIPASVYAHSYAKPTPWKFLTNVPGDLWAIAKSPFQKENLKGLVLVAAATAILIPLDQQLLDGVRHASDQISLQPQTDYHVLIKVGDTKILKFPKNFNTALYQIGEGGTSMAIAGGLFIYGKINKDYRALQTANDLAETFISMGVTTQIIKRISGRESPFMSTASGGRWRPLPSFAEYQRNTPSYDAFPSGHLATMMATVTVLSLNYPEKKWIKPVGYSLMGLSSWAMMNTEVHWVGDYPLALALGYLAGKITYWRHHKKTARKLKVL